MGNTSTEAMNTGIEDEGEGRIEERKEIMFWDIDQGNRRIHETLREPSMKGDISATMGHTLLQGRTRRERTLNVSRK